MEEKNFSKSSEILKEAKSRNLEITPSEVQNAIGKKKEDIWMSTLRSAPTAIRKQPEFQQTMKGSGSKFMPSKGRSYGTKPLWSSQPSISEEEAATEGTLSQTIGFEEDEF
jgi:hypothetical protein